MNEDLRRKKSECLLKLALEEQLERDAEMLKYKSGDEVENPHEFSKAHSKRIEEILKRAEKAEKHPRRFRRYHQIVAGFVLFFCISAFTIMQVEAFRLPVIRFFVEIRDKATLFGVENEDNQILTEKFEMYEPHYIPDDFIVQSVHEEDESFYIKYISNEKQQAYSYYFFDNMKNTIADTEDGTMVEIDIDGNSSFVIQKDGRIRILMNKNDKQFYLEGNIAYEEAVKIMKSIK